MQACKGTPGREIAPNTGVNATKSFTFVTKSGKILHSPILHYVSGAQWAPDAFSSWMEKQWQKQYIAIGKTDLFYKSMGLCGNFYQKDFQR